MSRPFCTMRPALCVSRPAMMRSSVVLPQPEGPSRQTNSPWATDRLTSRSAEKPPKSLETPSTPTALPLLGFCFGVIALVPFGEDAVTVLRRPAEVVLHQHLLVVRRHVGQRLGHARHRDDGIALGVDLVRFLGGGPVHHLAHRVLLLARLHDGGGFHVPAHAFLRKYQVDRRAR